ncbi:MAG: hypothetical protein JNM70_25130, partial [Anaerolineae bacterium]|nr:hypothetical protein [Anaerolineae bacterium]
GGDQQFADATSLDDDVEIKIPTIKSARTMTLEVFDDPTLAWYATVAAASDAVVPTAVLIQPPNGSKIVGNAYCRVINLLGDFVTSPEEIGDAGVLGLGVANAVDIFGLLPDGTPANNFTRVMQVCMRASSGDMLMFAAASGVPRSYVPLDTYISGDYICGFIDRAGTVVQIG